MFTQFFGHYLLNNHVVEPPELLLALQQHKDTYVSLGTIAITEGLLTSFQVQKIVDEQTQQDKKFGDIACELGLLSEKQVEHLQSKQTPAHLRLGQTLIDNNMLSTDMFAKHLNIYKEKYSVHNKDTESIDDLLVSKVMKDFAVLDGFVNKDHFTKYISLLFRNLVRFIGDDFIPLSPYKIDTFASQCVASQNISIDTISYHTLLCLDESSFINVASRYAKEIFTDNSELAKASVSEFLNLHNGLFMINLSNEFDNLELSIEPQEVFDCVQITDMENAIILPIYYSFGMLNLTFSTSAKFHNVSKSEIKNTI